MHDDAAPLVLDELAVALTALPRLGSWVEDAACAGLGTEGSAVFTSDTPDPDELDYAEATCWRCPVRQECADYAALVPSWGLWGARWYGSKGRAPRAA